MFGELDKGKIIAHCERFLERRGICVQQVSDYSQVEGIIGEAQKSYLTPIVSPAHHDLTQSNAIWLIGWLGDKPALVGGSRIEDLGGEELSTFWPRSLERLYGRPKGELVARVSPRVNHLLRGRLAYFGDLHINPDVRGMLSNVTAFVTIGHMLVSLKWNPDFTYALIREDDLGRGADFRYCFNHSFPGAMEWIDPPSPRSELEWCCAVSRDDLPDVAWAAVARLQRMEQKEKQRALLSSGAIQRIREA